MKFLFLFTFRQLVDAWRKFANSASKVIMLWYNRNSNLQENLSFRNKGRHVNSKAVYIQVSVEKWKLLAYHLEDLPVPQVGNPCITWK